MPLHTCDSPKSTQFAEKGLPIKSARDQTLCESRADSHAPEHGSCSKDANLSEMAPAKAGTERVIALLRAAGSVAVPVGAAGAIRGGQRRQQGLPPAALLGLWLHVHARQDLDKCGAGASLFTSPCTASGI